MLLPAGNLNKDIIKTIVYFDLFNYPLTSWEVWNFLPIKCNYRTIKKELSEMKIDKRIKLEEHHGFYYLPEKDNNIIIRHNRYNATHKKFKKAKRISWFFSFLPWIKLICMANIYGSHNLRTNGDIDFLIVAKENRLWITRLFCVGFVKFLRLRPHPGKTKDTICLSFMMDDSNLNLERILLNQSTENRDLHFTHWMAGLQPIYDKENTYQQLLQANSWINNHLPNWTPASPNYHRTIAKENNRIYSLIIDKLLGWSESLTKKFQYHVMYKGLKEKMNKSTDVVIDDHLLKLHLTDGREKYYQTYLNNLKNYV